MYDIIISGAGPVGSYLASLCARRMEVLVLEEDKEAGNKACSGLVSERFLKLTDSQAVVLPDTVQHKVGGAVIHFMGSDIEISKEKECFYVLDRDLLDKRMAENAESCGCEIRYGERVTGFSSGKDRITVKTGKGSYESRMVAGCDGARSAAASHMGSRPLEMVNGLIEIIDVPDHSGRVEMWFDPERNNDGFFWRIPRGENTEYGVMGKKADFRMLEGFFETNRKRVSKRWASPIPLGTAKTYGERMILVGDAACQTKPWSGGGLTYGILAADAAAPVIRKAVDKNDFSPRTLSAYEDAWSKIFGKDIKMGLVAREVYKNMAELGEEKIRQLVSSLKEKQQEIDFDFPFSHVMGDSFEI